MGRKQRQGKSKRSARSSAAPGSTSSITPAAREARSTSQPPSGETRAIDALTIFWMLSSLTALGLAVVGLVLNWAVSRAEGAERWSMLAELLLFAALISGLLTLLLTPLTVKLRRVAPPRPITWAAVLIGLLPLVIQFFRR